MENKVKEILLRIAKKIAGRELTEKEIKLFLEKVTALKLSDELIQEIEDSFFGKKRSKKDPKEQDVKSVEALDTIKELMKGILN